MKKSPSQPHALIQKAQEGDQQAFQNIYQLYYDRLLRYGCSIEPDEDLVHDVIQDLFVWLLQNPNTLSEVRNLDTYLFKCLRRNIGTSAQRARKKRIQASKYQSDQQLEFSVESRLIQSEDQQEQSNWLHAQLNRLSPHQREVIYLRFYENLSYDEIADIFHVSNQVVRNSVYRAVKKLRKDMGKERGHSLKGMYVLLLMLV